MSKHSQRQQQEETVRMHPKKKTKGGAVAEGTMSLVLIAGTVFDPPFLSSLSYFDASNRTKQTLKSGEKDKKHSNIFINSFIINLHCLTVI